MIATWVSRTGNTTNARQNGFTLVELLAVIAIIAILTSILLVALASARDSARTGTCLSNMRQFGVGLETYSQQYNISAKILPDHLILECVRDRGDLAIAAIQKYFQACRHDLK